MKSNYFYIVHNLVRFKSKTINLQKNNGRNKELQSLVQNGLNYERYKNNLISKIERENLRYISINCQNGRHRSVAFVELVAKELNHKGFPTKIIHLELK